MAPPVFKTGAGEPVGGSLAGPLAGEAVAAGDAQRPSEPTDGQVVALSAAWSDLDADARETVLRVAEGLAAARRSVRS